MKKKINLLSLLFFFLALQVGTFAQESATKTFQIKGLCVSAPNPKGVDRFVKFINEELGPRGINTLLVLVDYNYQFESYPQLSDSGALSKADVKKMVAVCRKNNIKIIPQINLLGHQSEGNKHNKLLTNFPQFDETPSIIMPEKYDWPY
jgi:hypothetical protein